MKEWRLVLELLVVQMCQVVLCLQRIEGSTNLVAAHLLPQEDVFDVYENCHHWLPFEYFLLFIICKINNNSCNYYY